jgi:PEGA domain
MRKTAAMLGVLLCWLPAAAFAAKPLLGEVEIEAGSKLERNAGLWLDGQYVGYVKDLTGKGRLVLVPGEHTLLFKLAGYDDVSSTIVVEPETRKQYRLAMRQAADVSYPSKAETAQLRMAVKPEEAAIFVNDVYVGHIGRFSGRQGMRLSAGTYRFTIALPGYEAFDTELTLRAGQTYEIKTELQKGRLGDQAVELTAQTPADQRNNRAIASSGDRRSAPSCSCRPVHRSSAALHPVRTPRRNPCRNARS